MKRVIFGFFATLLSVMSFGSFVQAQNLNNFTISKFEADYYLSQDSEGRSRLKTVEKITAQFPDYDQNHGLERAIPQSYEGHSTSLTIESITNEAGQKLPYSDSTSNDNLVLRIGDSDSYVHGEQTYIITYTQRDVTRYFADTNDDEFYWDINGTQWRVPIKQLEARVHVASSLNDTMNHQVSCYRGTEGSTTSCEVTHQSDASSGTLVSIRAENLQPTETATLAMGFRAHTFSGYQPSLQERFVALWGISVLVTSLVAIAIIIWLSVKYRRIIYRVAGKTIIPQYLPPSKTSVLVAGQVLKNNSSDVTAQLIDLAVRHYLKIYQTKEKTIWKQAEYELEVTKSLDSLAEEERGLLKDLFQALPKVGDRFNMKELQKSYALRKTLYDRRKKVYNQVRGEYALFEKAIPETRWFNRAGTILLIAGILFLSPLMLIAAIVVFIMAQYLWPYTQKGVDLREYLEGLKLYIGVAEKERLKLLQSPGAVEKVGKVGEKDTKQLVKLYERVLPYAVLFGQEKEWAKQLGVYYETSDTQPGWYAGQGAFNAVVFSSAVSGFSTASSSYSSSSSASTGGSGGGGSAGGGGGGGGGGGW